MEKQLPKSVTAVLLAKSSAGIVVKELQFSKHSPKEVTDVF
jgi:hypothetical protein